MDIFAHGLWSAAAARFGKEKEPKLSVGWSAFYGVFPDLFAFTVPFASRFFNLLSGHPHVPSLTGHYPAADWHEREAAEMFGFVFDGHPNPRNLLLEEDLHIHPLLKAHPLQAAEILQGIESGPPGFTIS